MEDYDTSCMSFSAGAAFMHGQQCAESNHISRRYYHMVHTAVLVQWRSSRVSKSLLECGCSAGDHHKYVSGLAAGELQTVYGNAVGGETTYQ